MRSLIRDLERDGYIERHLDADDRWKFNIRLTEAGRGKVRAHAGTHLRAVSECFGVLDTSEREALNRPLVKLRESACDNSDP